MSAGNGEGVRRSEPNVFFSHSILSLPRRQLPHCAECRKSQLFCGCSLYYCTMRKEDTMFLLYKATQLC